MLTFLYLNLTLFLVFDVDFRQLTRLNDTKQLLACIRYTREIILT
jgi:hypothetical protein